MNHGNANQNEIPSHLIRTNTIKTKEIQKVTGRKHVGKPENF